MRKTYKINESEGKFEIIDLPDGQKNIIFSDGTDVAKKMGVSGIDTIQTISGLNNGSNKIYICGTVPKSYYFLITDKDGGKMVPVPLTNVSSLFRIGIEIKGKIGYKLKQALVDRDLNIISDGWHDYIIQHPGTKNKLITTSDDGGENLLDTTTGKYLLVHPSQDIEYMSEFGIFKCKNEEDTFYLIDEYGNFLTDYPVLGLKELQNEYIVDEDKIYLNYILVSDAYRRSKIFSVNDGELCELEITDNGEKIDDYYIEETPNKDVFSIVYYKGKTMYNWIGYDGSIQFNKGITDILESKPIDIDDFFTVERNGKYNIVNVQSMKPVFDEEEWVDQIKQIDVDDNFDPIIAVKKDVKCNIIGIEYRSAKTMLEEWADDILVTDDGLPIVKYGNDEFLYYHGKPVRCDVCFVGKAGVAFVRKGGKWNALNLESTRYGFLSSDWFDNIYDIESYFPIIEKNGRLSFFDTPSKRVISEEDESGRLKELWFDDVEPYDDSKDDMIFTVYKDGEKFEIKVK